MSLGSLAIRPQTVEPVPLAPTRKRTLVVDDSETILHAICSLLEHHDVVEVAGRAESGTQAIDAVLELKPDLILMDADMPGMSGLENGAVTLPDGCRNRGHPDVHGHEPAIFRGVRRMRSQGSHLQAQIPARAQRIAGSASAAQPASRGNGSRSLKQTYNLIRRESARNTPETLPIPSLKHE